MFMHTCRDVRDFLTRISKPRRFARGKNSCYYASRYIYYVVSIVGTNINVGRGGDAAVFPFDDFSERISRACIILFVRAKKNGSANHRFHDGYDSYTSGDETIISILAIFSKRFVCSQLTYRFRRNHAPDTSCIGVYWRIGSRLKSHSTCSPKTKRFEKIKKNDLQVRGNKHYTRTTNSICVRTRIRFTGILLFIF